MDQSGNDPYSLYSVGQQAGLPQTPMNNGYQQQQYQQYQQGSPYGGGGGRGGGRGRGRGRQSRGGGGGWGGGGGMASSGSMQEDRQRADEERARRVRERIYKMGETDNGEDFFPQSDLFTIKKWIEEEGRKGNAQEQMILKAFRVMVTEQPHKTPLVAALLGFLIISPEGQRSSRADDGDNAMSGSSSDIPESLGVKIGKDLVKAFRSHLHSRLWRNVRLSLNFFASLAPLGIVSPSSMRTLLSAFSMVLNEPGVTVDRGDRAAMCIIEVLCRSGSDLIRPDLIPTDSEAEAVQIDDAALQEVNGMVEAVEAYAKGRRGESSLRRAWTPSTGEEADKDPLHEEGFEQAVEALVLLRSRQYRAPAFLPVATDLLPPAIVSISQDLLRGRGELSLDQYQIALPEVLVPPEEDDSEGFSFGGDYLKDGKPSKSRGRKKGVTLEKADEEVRRAGSGPEKTAVFARWFVESTPLAGTPSAVVLRSLINEVIDLYEVNRKECARILFGIAKWLRKGTFAGKAVSPDTGLFGDAEDLEWVMADPQDPQGGWTIDDVIVECILSASLLLPQPPHVPLYYHSLLREITTLSPQTLAPAIGRTVRRIYGASRTGRVSSEVLKRFAEWFSAHLSNFNFSWGWKEWIPDMRSTHSHPAKAFARRVAELEIRLAYYDRIKGTLPEEIQEGVLRPEEPTPCFTYERPDHPYHARATALNNSLRARATAPVVLAELESLKRDLIVADSTFPDEDDPMASGKVSTEAEADIIVRDIMTQVVLHIGSRSFSHFLNIVERYHALLRQLSSTPSMRLAILTSTTRFWARSPQWVMIVLDKLMQYRIVEPADVVAFVFDPPTAESLPRAILSTSGDAVPGSFSKLIALPGGQYTRDWSNFDWFEIIRLTIEKVNGRVGQVRRRLARLQREEAEEAERKEAAAAAAAETTEDGNGNAAAASTPVPKVPFSFPTSASLPRRPDLGAAVGAASPGGPSADKTAEDPAKKKKEEEEKRQTVEETKSALESILSEQRKVLAGAFKGLADHYRRTSTLAASAAATAAAAAGAGDEEGEEGAEVDEEVEELEWKAWWAREWYLAYLRQFNRDFATIQETLSAVFVGQYNPSGAEGATDDVRALFEEACRMAYE